MIGGRRRVFAILGDPIAHSLSPAMQNAAFRALGLDAVFVAQQHMGIEPLHQLEQHHGRSGMDSQLVFDFYRGGNCHLNILWVCQAWGERLSSVR